jgi:hypothetical protein
MIESFLTRPLKKYHDSPQQDYWHTTAECAAEMSGILPYREKLTESASTVEDEFDLRAHDEMQTGGDCRDGSPE